MRHYKIGDTMPLEGREPIQVGQAEPRWYPFESMPQKEKHLTRWLEVRGVDGWYPTEEQWRVMARGPRRKVAYQRKCVPGYVFARFEGLVRWDLLRDCPFFRGVITSNGDPARITDDAMANMEQMPTRLQELAEKKKIHAGDAVEVTDGPWEGWEFTTAAVKGEVVTLVSHLLGDIEMPLKLLRKKVD